MRALIAAISIIVLVLSVVGCQGEIGLAGEQGPPGPPGPAGDIASLDEATIASIIEQIQEMSNMNLAEARKEDSERLDNLVHLIIENTRNPAFKERLSSLDLEIHRVFDSAAAAAPNQATVQAFELVEGIVVVSSIMDAIAEARIAGDSAARPSAPPKWESAEYTKHFVKAAINKYDTEGIDATVVYYNTKESVDSQWYMLIFDPDDMMLAHAVNPDLVRQPASAAAGPNNYPAGEAVVAAADEDGAWFSHTFTNPASGAVEVKHSWMVE